MTCFQSTIRACFLLFILLLLTNTYAVASTQDSLLNHINLFEGDERLEAYKDVLSSNLLSPDQWEDVFNKAVDYAEDYSEESTGELFYYRGLYKQSQFQFDQAVEAFTQSIELLVPYPKNSHYAGSYILRAQLYAMMQRDDLASADFKVAFDVIKENNAKEPLSLYYTQYGRYLGNKGEGIAAISCYTKAMNLHAELGNKGKLIMSKYAIAQQYMLMGLYENAKIGFLEIVQETEESLYPIYLDASYSLAHIFLQLEQTEPAKNYFEDAAEGFKTINEPVRAADSYFGLGKCYLQEEQYIKALDYFKESEQIYKSTNATGIEYPMYGIGMCYLNSGEFDQAINNIRSALHISKKNNDILAITQGFTNMGVFYSEMGMPEVSEKYFDSAHVNLSIYPYDLIYQDYYKAIIKHYVKNADFESAHKAQSDYTNYRDSVLSAKVRLSNEDVRIKLETARIEKENVYLEEELKIEKLENQRLIWILSISVLILLLVSILFFNKQKLNKQKALAQKERIERMKFEKEALEISQQKTQQEILNKNRLLEVSSMHLIKLAASSGRINDWLKQVRPYANAEGKKKIQSFLTELTEESYHDHWLEFERTFVERYPSAKQKITENYPDLTQSEFRFICFLLMDLSQTEIAHLTLQSSNSVRSVFYRLRKKLKVDTQEELSSLVKNLFQ